MKTKIGTRKEDSEVLVEQLCLNDWIIAVETLLRDKHNTISEKLPLNCRPKSAWWREGLTPQEAVNKTTCNLTG